MCKWKIGINFGSDFFVCAIMNLCFGVNIIAKNNFSIKKQTAIRAILFAQKMLSNKTKNE